MRNFDIKKDKTLASICDAAEVSATGILWLNSDGQTVATNENLKEELGYLDQSFPSTIFEINPTLSLLAWKKLWKKAGKLKKVVEDSEFITSEDSIYPIRLRCTLLETDEHQLVMMSCQNLMHTKRYEDLFRLTSRIANLGSWEWDLVKNEFLFNDEMYMLLEIPRETELTQTYLATYITQGISEKEFAANYGKLQTAMESGTPFDIDVSFGINGNFKNLQLHAHPVLLEEQVIKIYGTLQNVSNISKRTDDMYFTKFCMDYARDMIYWLDKDSIIQYANQTACERLGYSYEVLIGKSITFIDHSFKGDVQEFWENLKQETKNFEFESIHTTKSGEAFPVQITTNYINFRGKEFNCGFVRDLSNKRKRDELLNLSKNTLDNSPNPTFWADEDGRFKYFNQAFIDRMGYSPKELETMKVLDFIHNGTEERYKKGWKRLKKDKFHNDVFRNMLTKNGEIFPAEMTISMIEEGDNFFSTTTLKDISERQKMNQQATMSKHTLDHSLDMIFWLNKDGSFKYFNETFVKKTKFSVKEIQKKNVLEFIPNSNIEILKRSWGRLQKGAVLLGLDRDLKIKTGEIIPCEMNISMVQLNDEEFAVIVLRDISERKIKEREIQQQLIEIEQLQKATEAENIELREEIELEFNFNNIISRDPNYKKVLRQVEQVATTSATVLILGETGTGKELLARAIHRLSERNKLPMIKVNCGALPKDLIESELFGHEKGAFTGAYQQKIGKFERANGGTIFLDEMGELPMDMQTKLLRVIQEGEIERIGGTELLHIDVRIIAATNRNLEEEVGNGNFREDLFYRLNVFPIYNIPLRERREDIPILVKYFVEKYSKKMNKEISQISPSQLNKLVAYDFLGNVRELENLVERAVILSSGKTISFDLSTSTKKKNTSSKFLTMEELQKKHIIDALKRTDGRVSGTGGAADLLEMNDKTLTSRMRKLGIDKRDFLI